MNSSRGVGNEMQGSGFVANDFSVSLTRVISFSRSSKMHFSSSSSIGVSRLGSKVLQQRIVFNVFDAVGRSVIIMMKEKKTSKYLV